LDGALQKLVAFVRTHPEAGIVGGRTLHADRSLNPTSCWARPTVWSAFCQGSALSALFPRIRWFNPEVMPGWRRDTVQEVDIVTGCFLLIRRELWEELGGFDPAFFMYGEDADLCLRAKNLGHKCLICPEATIIHYGGASEKVRADKMVRLFRAKAQLFAKHWSRKQAKLGVRTLDLWALTRMMAYGLATGVGSKKDESYATWRSVWRRRNEWHAMLHVAAHSELSVSTDV
jgi:N-acetylglucosaminyl-diphospho-decaprenol L-rhamnosyltransferase